MPKNMLRGLSLLAGVLFLFGCASTGNKKIEVRRYVEVKDRVDQNMDEGNAGFIMGTPQPEDRSGIRKTRKVYVLEVTEVPGEEETVMMEDNEAIKQAGGEEDMEAEEENMEATDMDETYEEDEQMGYGSGGMMEAAPPAVTTAKPSMTSQEYTVQKDDTLQKISKKFYDSYSKWPKIYDANKDVISDPDRIKPGITIQIPME